MQFNLVDWLEYSPNTSRLHWYATRVTIYEKVEIYEMNV